jgi:hypothetical protein
MQYTELEQAVNSVLKVIGTNSLIKELKSIETRYNFKEDERYQTIINIVLQYFEITESDLSENGRLNTNIINAKRINVYLLSSKTTIPKHCICHLNGISTKTFDRYLLYVHNIEKSNNRDLQFAKALNDIKKIFEN